MKPTPALLAAASALLSLTAIARAENFGLQQPYEVVSERYLVIQNKLASDDFNGVTAAAKAMLSVLDREKGTDLADLDKAVSHLAAAPDLATARAAFKEVSTDLVARFKQEHVSTGMLHEVYCPAAHGCWIQTDPKDAHNPYFGKEMPNCGDPVGSF